jgi:hypothetical protein
MNRKCLVAAASLAPWILLAAGPSRATDSISTTTSTPVTTATATNSAPDNIDITSSGSIGPTASGIAVTLNSSNVVTNEGSLGFTALDNSIGIQVQGGNTGSVTNTGSITVTDNYTATTDNNTGLLTGVFAQGTNRIGIQVAGGTGAFTGGISNFGAITVHGDSSYGVDIEAPMTGSYLSVQVTPATSSTAETTASGTITVLGGETAANITTGFHVGPTGSIGGDLTLGYVSATGFGAKAVDIEGAVGGVVNLTGAITDTGYRSTARSTYPTIATQYTAAELQQGGVAVTIGANVGGGLILSAPPLDAVTNASTASDLIANTSILQTLQGTGSITSYGQSPALLIGSSTKSVEIGVVGAANTVFGEGGSGAYGFVNQGAITGNGVFDQLSTPNLPAAVPATAIQIGMAGGQAAIVDGGIYNTGAINALAYQASATAIHFYGGGQTPLILNDGVITANSIQQSTATTGVPPVNVYGILIESGANVGSLINNSNITANITGTGGVGGTAGAIIDRSGTLTSILNTGTVTAQATQTLITAPMPITATAIDLSAGTTAQTITQSLSSNSTVTGSAAYNNTISYSQGQIVNYAGLVYQATTAAGVAVDPLDYPSYWRQIGAISPYINGSILFGSGGGNLTVNAGAVTGEIINLGTGPNNSLTINGAAGSLATATSVTGAIEEVGPSLAQAQVIGTAGLAGGGDGSLNIKVNNGTLTDTNPNVEHVNSVNVGANGVLVVAADPAHGLNTEFIAGGASTFAQGAQLGVALVSIPTSLTQTYTVLQTTGSGTLSAGTFGTAALSDAPWLYTATASYVPAAAAGDPSEIQLTVTRKSAAQIGFNAAEASALDAVLAAAPANTVIQTALLTQNTESGLKSVYDQLLPSQGQGLFDSLDAAAQAIGAMTSTAPEAASRVAGTSLWLQEINERVDRSGINTEGSNSKLLGIVGGYELMGGGGGALGLTLAYFNASEQDKAVQIGSGVVASMVEAGAYYRRSVGHFTVSARAAVGYASFSDNRVFVTSTTINNSTTGAELAASSHWDGLFYDGHFGAAFEQSLGRFYARPELSADFLQLDESSHSDSGGGNAFDLNIASRDSSRLSGQAIMVLGREWGHAAWLRTELHGGYREILSGSVGDTVASFNGGNPFTLAPENDKGGWLTAGFAIKGGSQYSYLALEGDIDFRAGEQRYDLRIAGKSIF